MWNVNVKNLRVFYHVLNYIFKLVKLCEAITKGSEVIRFHGSQHNYYFYYYFPYFIYIFNLATI